MPTDVRFALRMLGRTPGLTSVALLSLAVSLGLATAAFTVVHGAFLSPLPVPGAERLVMVHQYDRAGRFNIPATAADLTATLERVTSFEGLGAWFSRSVTLGGPTGGSSPQIARAAYVSVDALEITGIVPASGRLPRQSDVEPGAQPVALISHDLALRYRTTESISIAGMAHRVIGVMPEGVRFPIREDLLIPVQVDARSLNATPESLTMFGRLREGVSRDEAAAELTVVFASRPGAVDRQPALVPVVMPFARGFMSPEQEWALYGLLAGVSLFLLVIAANVANLFLARNSARSGEIVVRTALGASRRQLVHQLLLESVVLGCAAAIGGLVVSRLALAWFVANVPDMPWWADFTPNSSVVGFAAVSALFGSIVSGVSPALRLTRPAGGLMLQRSASRGSSLRFSRAGALLFAAQLAVSVGCLSVVGVLAQGLYAFGYERYGIEADTVLVSQVYLGPPSEADLAAAGEDRRSAWLEHFERSHATFERIRIRLLAIPGVEAATFSTHYPGNDVERVQLEFEPGATAVTTRIAAIGADFFKVLGKPLIHGRDFGAADLSGSPRTAIVNAPFAAKYFRGRSPVGQRIRRTDADARTQAWLEVVGVAPDLGLNPGDEAHADGIYVPFTPSNFARIAVRSRGAPAALVPTLHRVVLEEHSRAQIQSAETLAAIMRAAETVFRGLGDGLVLVGGTALLLSAVSFYSLVAFAVTQRTREIGIRLALGATRARVTLGVLRRELRLVVAGAVAGVFLGAGLYNLVAIIPFDLKPAASSLVAAALGLVVLVGAGACLVPVRRILRVQPAEALRHE